MSQKSLRERYLNQVWALNPYPGVKGPYHPKAEGFSPIFGRIQRLRPPYLEILSGEADLTFEAGPELELAQGFSLFDVLNPGDIVALKVLNSEKRETPLLKDVQLLVPALGDKPFETRFDFSRARQWQEFVQTIRNFFVARHFVELRTPTLVPSPGLEPHLDPFETEFHFGRRKTRFFLPTSPEFHLKKALTLGFEKCFEFKECFRNAELSAHHQPEFLMLEWYRAFENNDSLIEDLAHLLRHLQGPGARELKVLPMEDLWREELNFNLTPETTAADLHALAKKLELDAGTDGDNFDDLFARIFLERLEPALAQRAEPVVIKHFPPSQAALARLTKDGWADRFELYWRGFEIANAFHELNDPQEQRRRFQKDQEKKRELGKTVVPVDEEFLKALDWGLPPSAGIALGVERLFMALHGLDSLDEVRLFPMK